MCRSDYNDDRSQEVIRNLEELGCSVDTLTGDVAVLEDVRRYFADMKVLGLSLELIEVFNTGLYF